MSMFNSCSTLYSCAQSRSWTARQVLLASQARPRSPRAGWTDRDAVRRPSSLPDAESPHARKMSTMEAEKRTKESRTRRSGGREFANGSHVKKCWNGFVPSWTNLTFSALLGPQGRRCDAEARATDVSCQLESRLRRMRDFLRGERTYLPPFPKPAYRSLGRKRRTR